MDEAWGRRLRALLDTVLPASEDGSMPSAAELDFMAYLEAQAADFQPLLAEILERFDNGFADQPLAARVAQVRDFASEDGRTFNKLVFRVYDCYYQNARVRGLIGTRPVPIFPAGHEIPAGDLASLAAVQARGKGYRE